jgi:putative spermidine/putrescine transport system substrate-binding protein
MFTRRAFVATAAVTIASGRAAAQTSGDLVVNWTPGVNGVNFKTYFVDSFDHPDATRIIELFDGPRFTQMIANRRAPTFDVGVFTNVTIPLVSRSKLAAPLDKARIPSLADVDPAIATTGGLSTPIAYGCWGIAYDARRVKVPIESWADLLRDDLKGHVSAPNITYSSSVCSLDALASLKGGSLQAPSAGFEAMRQIRLSGPGLWEQDGIAVGWLKSGEIWATPFNGAQILALMQRPDAENLRFVVPKDGGYYLGFNAIKVANAPHPDRADRFIDHILSLPVQSAYGQGGAGRPVNVKAACSEAVERAIPPVSKLRQLDWDYLSNNREAISDAWNKAVNS